MTDPTTALAAFAPDHLTPPTLPPSDVAYVVEDTRIGRMLLACNAAGALLASRFVPDSVAEDQLLARLSERVSPRVLRQPAQLDLARRELDDYLDGRITRFSLRTDLALATDFQRLVLSTLPQVGYGRRATYAELATRAHRPSAARAVGAALGANPLCVVLPCHRIVGASGALTGYAGGVAAKRYLLDLEAG